MINPIKVSLRCFPSEQPAKGFGEQSDYADDCHLGSVDDLTDGYQQS
jgi:hypothetical protein